MCHHFCPTDLLLKQGITAQPMLASNSVSSSFPNTEVNDIHHHGQLWLSIFNVSFISKEK